MINMNDNKTSISTGSVTSKKKTKLFALKLKAPKNRGCPYVVAWNEGNVKVLSDLQNPADKISVKEAKLKILQDEAIALTSWALTWFLGKVIPANLYANMTVLQIHEEMAFAVMSFVPV
jgi:hypothetical protein